MDSLIETVSITLSLVALFLVPFVLFIAYLIKRNGLYVNVNCWFCNTWTKVRYADRNSFNCPACLQYNGFNEDGDYNKTIDAQYDTSGSKHKILQKTAPVTNGLCTYCNNNQQLKIYQLANFVPLNENNYDLEVEHFEKQLEKAYKLCKKCDSVLKTTIQKQHAWLFGFHLKGLKKKSTSSQNLNKTSQMAVRSKMFCLNVIKLTLILFCVFVICQTLNIKVDYSPLSKINPYTSNIFVPCTLLLRNISDFITNASASINDIINEVNPYLPSQVKFSFNSLVPLTCIGFLFQVIFVIGNQGYVWWKINQLLGWILLVMTSLILFDERYLAHIKLLQAFCSATIICSLLSSNKLKTNSMHKKVKLKKIRSVQNADCSDVDEDISEDCSSFFSERADTGESFKCYNANAFAYNYRASSAIPQSFLFQDKVQNTANLTTARSTKTASMSNRSVKSDLNSSNELNHSLDNLHISNLKPQTCTSPIFSVSPVNRPVLSPPKLKNVTQNSWAAGGFWKNEASLFPTSEITNLSRSSSQTSGFVSNNDPVNLNPFNSLPPSRDPSVCGDFERASILSESPYHFQPINSNGLNSFQSKNVLISNVPQSPKFSLSPNSSQLYYKADNMFYPVLNQNNMLFIQSSHLSNNFENNFSNLSLRSFNTSCSGIKTPPLFGKQPVVSSLFKNLSGVSTQSHSFKIPHS